MKLILAAAVAILLLSLPALADVAAPATTTIVTTTGVPPVVIPWGDWLDAAITQVVLPILAMIVSALVAWAATFLPASLRAFVTEKNTKAVDQLLTNAVANGLKQVDAEAQGKTLNVAVGSKAVAQATQYALDHGAPYLIKWAGGAEGIQQKIVARLPVPASVATTSSALPFVSIPPVAATPGSPNS